MSLKTFFERAATKISETVTNSPKTVDSEYQAKKTLFKSFEKELLTLHRRLMQYFKEVSNFAKNFEKIAESSKLLFYPEETCQSFGEIEKNVFGALERYEERWNGIKEDLILLESVVKTVAKKLSERDNARVDFDRCRIKWEKNMTDPVLEATAKASENVFHEKNHESNEILEKFLEKRFENVESIMTGVAEATRILYSSCAEMTGFKSVKMDTNVFEIESFISNSTIKKSPRDSSVESSNLAQLKKSPRNSPALSRPARSLPPAPKKKEKEMRAIYDFTPAADDQEGMAVREGETVVFVDMSEDGQWVMVAKDGHQGYVPNAYLEHV